MTDLDVMVMPVDTRPAFRAVDEARRLSSIPVVRWLAIPFSGAPRVGVPVWAVRVETMDGTLTMLPGRWLVVLAWLGRAFGSVESHG